MGGWFGGRERFDMRRMMMRVVCKFLNRKIIWGDGEKGVFVVDRRLLRESLEILIRVGIIGLLLERMSSRMMDHRRLDRAVAEREGILVSEMQVREGLVNKMVILIQWRIRIL
jgi:hypothetical protein